MAEAERYPIPAGTARAEIVVVNSRFIGTAGHTPSVEAAKAFIAGVRAEMPTATHHCYAYSIGYGASVTAGMSDAGEPAGTAGRPMLAVLRGANLGDVTVVVTRYFGGTLLGTGGLVRAYGDATKAVLAVLPRAERVELHTALARVSYGDYAAARRLLEAHQGTVLAEDFAADITITITLPVHCFRDYASALAEATAGRAEIVAEGPALS